MHEAEEIGASALANNIKCRNIVCDERETKERRKQKERQETGFKRSQKRMEMG
jgi:hypothetical protein